MEIRVVKEKKGVATVIEYKGNRYTLQHPHQMKRGLKKSIKEGGANESNSKSSPRNET